MIFSYLPTHCGVVAHLVESRRYAPQEQETNRITSDERQQRKHKARRTDPAADSTETAKPIGDRTWMKNWQTNTGK